MCVSHLLYQPRLTFQILYFGQGFDSSNLIGSYVSQNLCVLLCSQDQGWVLGNRTHTISLIRSLRGERQGDFDLYNQNIMRELVPLLGSDQVRKCPWPSPATL
jgi:hypothetical protein